MKQEPKKFVSILLPAPLHAQLREQANATCRSLSGYIRQVLKQHLRELEQAPGEAK